MPRRYDFKKLGLLPYQERYLQDDSAIKIYEKSRRIGITRTQALEDVLDAGIYGKYDVWFSSNNDLNGREYIRYCHQFVKGFALITKELAGIDIVEDNKLFSIAFKNGKRITALSSSPEQLHGKGGKIVLDEFARRADQSEVWEAASPAALIWNNPIRIISTHNGVNSLFNHFIKKVNEGHLHWSLLRTTFVDAVAEGLADKVCGRKLTDQERQQYIATIRSEVASSTIWAQQFMCEPQDEAECFISRTTLDKAAKAELLPFDHLLQCKTLYAGLDVGRFNNLTVLWITEQVSSTQYITRFVRVIKDTDFPQQEHIIAPFLSLPNLRRLCIDQTGLGIGLLDYLQKRFGTSRVEGVHFTAAAKEKLAFRLQKYLADTSLHIPNEEHILDDFHSIKQDTTAAGNIRLRAATNEDTGSHADFFWAAALALEAAALAHGDPFAIKSIPFSDLKKCRFNSFLQHFKYP